MVLNQSFRKKKCKVDQMDVLQTTKLSYSMPFKLVNANLNTLVNGSLYTATLSKGTLWQLELSAVLCKLQKLLSNSYW